MSLLEGVRVVSFTHFLQGPSATALLADLGATVIKVEPPSGAFERSWSAPDAYLNGESVFFLLGNRNVESVVVDLKDPEWLKVVLRLLDEADVLIESFRPGVMDRLGLGWERLRERNSRLVYCSLSGYGSDGPYKDRPGRMFCCSRWRALRRSREQPTDRRRRWEPRSLINTGQFSVLSGSWPLCTVEIEPGREHGWRATC